MWVVLSHLVLYLGSVSDKNMLTGHIWVHRRENSCSQAKSWNTLMRELQSDIDSLEHEEHAIKPLKFHQNIG